MEKLKGLFVSRGTIKGVARIVQGAERVATIEPNTILVMRVLDRELLINLDKNVVGVIAEHGNIGSHGAGILRQLHIPCIIRIHNVTALIKDGDNIIMDDKESCILIEKFSEKSIADSNRNITALKYLGICKHPFSIKEIRTLDTLVCLRPDRHYQKLRFDILKEAHENGPRFLYGLPKTRVEQNEDGAIIEYGAPSLEDICSFILDNPNWLVEKSKQRTTEINGIKCKLLELNQITTNLDTKQIIQVFSQGIELYRDLFKYVYMSQAISDEFLDIYLDFISDLLGEKVTDDILSLRSDYVNNCMESKIDPGVSQIWKVDKATPHIWQGKIDYGEFPENDKIIDIIKTKENSEQLLKDYRAFRIIVPLVYQLSEEFFYVSSSINSYINWSIVNICKIKDIGMSIEDFYKKPLSEILCIINKLEV